MSKQQKRNEWVGLAEAGEILGVTRQRVHQLIESYGLTAKKMSPRFTVICRTELTRLQKMRKSGRYSA